MGDPGPKAKHFEVKTSNLLCTQVDLQKNIITGSYKAVKIYDQKGAAKCSISVVGAIVRRVRDVTGI